MAENTSFIQNVNQLVANLQVIIEAKELFNEESINTLEELTQLDIALITADLKKSNYLGNRKIDINLALNNLSEDTHVSYESVTITLNDGVQLEINFTTLNDDGSTSILELTSHADIKNYIVNSQLFIDSVINTEVTVEDEIGTSPQLIRFRDTDGRTSNIDRLILNVYSGTASSINSFYYWAKTTSSLQTLANRIDDVIALGQRIDKIIALADKEDEIQYLYNTRSKIEILYTNMQKIIDVEANLAAIINAPVQAQLAITKAQETADIRDQLLAIIPTTLDLASNESSFISYNPTTGAFIIGLPKGPKGDIGESFNVDKTGTLANKSNYDGASQGFAYLSLDEAPTKVYFKKSDDSGDWTDGVPFGKGDTGVGILDINRTNGDGSAGTTDTYTITLTDNTTKTFTVTHGSDLKNSQIIDDTTTSTDTVYSSSKVDDLLLDIELGIPT